LCRGPFDADVSKLPREARTCVSSPPSNARRPRLLGRDPSIGINKGEVATFDDDVAELTRCGVDRRVRRCRESDGIVSSENRDTMLAAQKASAASMRANAGLVLAAASSLAPSAVEAEPDRMIR
jgi:hypothetical protein